MQYIVKDILMQVNNYAYSKVAYPAVDFQLPSPNESLESGSGIASGLPVPDDTFVFSWNNNGFVNLYCKLLSIGEIFDFPQDANDLALIREDPSSCRSSKVKYLFICEKL